MTNLEPESGTTREELVQRVALMELMISEGRRSTGRFGWVFVLWGLADLTGMSWQILWHSYWCWPITMTVAFILQFAGIALHRRSGNWGNASVKSRSIGAVWSMMGVAISLYCFSASLGHHFDAVSMIAAILMFVGFAHATSAIILRWAVQGIVAGIWWAGGVACFFVPSENGLALIFMLEMLFGMVFFGLYAMWQERQRALGRVQQHA